MSTTKFEHVIGRDGKVRIRKTCVENGQVIGNSHEGFSDHREARNSECRNFEASLRLIGCDEKLAKTFGDMLFGALIQLPTVDERVREPEADPLRHERVFGSPNDSFEPQTPTEN